MKNTFWVICLILLFSENLLTRELKSIKVNVLTKTSLSWDGKNEGNETVVIIAFYAGIKGRVITVKKKK